MTIQEYGNDGGAGKSPHQERRRRYPYQLEVGSGCDGQPSLILIRLARIVCTFGVVGGLFGLCACYMSGGVGFN